MKDLGDMKSMKLIHYSIPPSIGQKVLALNSGGFIGVVEWDGNNYYSLDCSDTDRKNGKKSFFNRTFYNPENGGIINNVAYWIDIECTSNRTESTSKDLGDMDKDDIIGIKIPDNTLYITSLPHIEWISVKDRMPEHIGVLLIYSFEDDLVYIGMYEKDEGFSDWENSGITYDNITHWMYLQDIPKPLSRK